MHRSTWSLIERGRLDRTTVETLRACLAVLEVRLELRPHWRGAELDRLLDQAHASLQAAWVDRLVRRGWRTWVERSYSVYGERGRIDILGYHPPTQTLLVVEIKSELADAQSLLGTLDAKVRLAPAIARAMALRATERAVPMIVFKESMTTRRRVARLAELFASYATRGSDALAWLRSPTPGPRGLLIFSGAVSRRGREAGRHSVRSGGTPSSTKLPLKRASAASPGAIEASASSRATGDSG
jgi:hypothetical protein